MTQLLDNPYEMRAEIWKEYPLNTKYLISNLGNAKRKSIVTTHGRKLPEQHLTPSKNGYTIIYDDKKFVRRIDRLVSETFNVIDFKSLSLNDEVWVDIIGYHGYQVSNKGRVRSLNRKYRYGVKILLPKIDNGYFRYTLYKDKKKNLILAHRLVAKHFIPNDNTERIFVNHINKLKSDNSVENLEWVTVSENNLHSSMDKDKNLPYIYRIKDKFSVVISYNKVPNRLGHFSTIDEAIDVRDAFIKEKNITNKYI